MSEIVLIQIAYYAKHVFCMSLVLINVFPCTLNEYRVSLVLIQCIPMYLGIKGDPFFQTKFFWRPFYVQIGIQQFVSWIQISIQMCPKLQINMCEIVCNKLVQISLKFVYLTK